MKQTFLLLLGVFSLASVMGAERVEINQHGEVREVASDSEEWYPLSPAEKEAYDNPGVEVPKELSRDWYYQRVDFFHVVVVRKYDETLLRTGKKIETLQRSGERRGQPLLALHIIIFLVSILFLVMSNLLYWWKEEVGILVFRVAVFFATLAAIIFLAGSSLPGYFFYPTIFVALATIFVAIAADNINSKAYTVASVLFYIFVALAIWPW